MVNDPQTELYTRITECKHLTGQVHPETALTSEYPAADGDPYDPIPRPENQALFRRYESLARATPDVWFVGRLATYRCSNMDQIVAQALATFERVDAALPRRGAGAVGIPGPVVAPDVRTPAVRGGVRREAGAGALTLE